MVGEVVASMVASPSTPACDFQIAVLNSATSMVAFSMTVLEHPARARQMIDNAMIDFIIHIITKFRFFVNSYLVAVWKGCPWKAFAFSTPRYSLPEAS